MIGSLLAACASPGLAHAITAHTPSVLFVCQFGTVKSAISREVFRRRAAKRNIAIAAFSRGIIMEDHPLSPELLQQLGADGIDPNADPATILTAADWMRADVLIWFNSLPPEVNHSAMRDWSDLPSFNDSFALARPILERRIDALLDELSGLTHQT